MPDRAQQLSLEYHLEPKGRCNVATALSVRSGPTSDVSSKRLQSQYDKRIETLEIDLSAKDAQVSVLYESNAKDFSVFSYAVVVPLHAASAWSFMRALWVV
jgi:hypothetical protein